MPPAADRPASHRDRRVTHIFQERIRIRPPGGYFQNTRKLPTATVGSFRSYGPLLLLFFDAEAVEHDGKELHGDGDCHQPCRVCIVQRAQQPAPQKPRDAEARLEDAEARAAHGGRDDAADGTLYLDFHYCPLVKAWQKAGCTDEEIARLCDIDKQQYASVLRPKRALTGRAGERSL